MSNKTCCYQCDKRTMTCHSSCKDYIDFSKDIREKRQKEFVERSKGKMMEDYVIKIKNKMKRKGR